MVALLNILTEVIAYSHTLSAVYIGVNCSAMGLLLKGHSESSSPEQDRFFAQTSTGLSVTAIVAVALFIMAGAARIFFLIRAGGFQAGALAGGAVLLLPLCFGPFIWFRLHRTVSRLKTGK